MACCRGVGANGHLGDIERARRFFCIVTQRFGAIPAIRGWSASTPDGGNEAANARTMIDRFHQIANRLASVTIESVHALDLIAQLDSSSTVFYIDPPHLASVRSWAAAQDRKRDYRVEFQTDHEHHLLATILNQCAGTVLLSGYPSRLYDDHYPAWQRVDAPSTSAGGAPPDRADPRVFAVGVPSALCGSDEREVGVIEGLVDDESESVGEAVR